MNAIINKNGKVSQITDLELDAKLDSLMNEPKTKRFKEGNSTCVEISDNNGSVAIIDIDLSMKEINFVTVSVYVAMIDGSQEGKCLEFFQGENAVFNAKKFAFEKYTKLINNWK
jgi:hypothetical protein